MNTRQIRMQEKSIPKCRKWYFIMIKEPSHQKRQKYEICKDQVIELQNIWSKSDWTNGRNRQIHNYKWCFKAYLPVVNRISRQKLLRL